MTSEMKYMYESIKLLLCMQYFSKEQQSCYQVFAGKAIENHLHELALTVMILSLRTDRLGQTVKTQIRLLLEQQSDQVYPVCHSLGATLFKF